MVQRRRIYDAETELHEIATHYYNANLAVRVLQRRLVLAGVHPIDTVVDPSPFTDDVIEQPDATTLAP